MQKVNVLLKMSVLAVMALAGCKATPAPDSGFIEDSSKMKRNPDSPFAKGYWNREVSQKKYTEIYVSPVNTKYVLAQNIWEGANAVQVKEEDIRKALDQMGKYMQDAFKKAAAEDPRKRFVLVDKPGPNTIVLEMAIVQLVPSKAALNALGFITWIPTAVTVVGSSITQSQDQGKGVIAIEARLRDGATGEVVGMFADRECPPTALLDIKAMNWWAPCKAVIDTWAKQFIEVANNPGKKVSEAKTFELLVW
ncbi:MAG: DUF3313 domain-containing protein [Planctomycetota bacterium]|nr:DUF3313 domain-containing protein [Planctomycetota bacterium]